MEWNERVSRAGGLEEGFLNALSKDEPLSVISAFESACLSQYVH